MSRWINVTSTLPRGIRAAGISDRSGPWIALHIDVLNLDDDDIAECVRKSAAAAWYAEAQERADYILSQEKRRVWEIDQSVIHDEALLSKYAGASQFIDDALRIIERIKTYHKNRQAKPAKRREIQNDYDRLFVKIGRRDGFKCAYCASVENLAIDHIKALANGGSNDLTNLQILCGPCNSRKGARD